MKSSDRLILLVLAGLGLVAAFWFLLLSPKRGELSELEDQRAALQSTVAEQETVAAQAEEAEADYADNYQRLVSIGKAVPSANDTASLMVQTSALAKRAKIDFESVALAEAGAAEPAEPAAPAEGGAAAEEATAQPTAAPATEASAATLPIGATVGTAGLPVMPYDLVFNGDFFEIADFMRELDSGVRTKGTSLDVEARLLTVDGFSLSVDEERGFPHLEAKLRVTSFITPPDQGTTGGATQEAPPSTLSASPVPVSTP
jgi:hypothetical protein